MEKVEKMQPSQQILHAILGLEKPWCIAKFNISHSLNRIDVWIDQEVTYVEKSRWFGLKKIKVQLLDSRATAYTKWRHLNLERWPLYVHSPLPLPTSLMRMPWTGERGQQFSHALGNSVFSMMGEGASLATICAVLQVDLIDLWKYKQALDKGQIGVQASDAKFFNQAFINAESLAKNAAGSAVPSIDHPVWQAIASGTMELEIKTLSLRLLLTRVKSQYFIAADNEVRALRIRELHRFFEKNQRLLSHELRQIM